MDGSPVSKYSKAEYVEAFNRGCASDDIELYTTRSGRTRYSPGADEGAWVLAWVWVPDYLLDEDKEQPSV
jgi:hypothetical protein